MKAASGLFRALTQRRVFWVVLLTYFLLRIGLGLLPGYVNDIQQYKNWAAGTALYGVGPAYDTTTVDYPPLMLFLLYLVGKTYLFLQPPTATGVVSDSALFTLLIKTPHLIFDLLLAGLLYHLVAVRGLWKPRRAAPEYGRLAALLYLWSPPVLWGSAYWGQPDGVHSALALASMAALSAGRIFASGALLAVAGLMKPLAAPLVPLLALGAAMRQRLPGLLLAAAGGLTAGAVVFLPFFISGRGPRVVRIVFFEISGLMPFTSVNGHNLWWILGPWRNATTPLAGPLSAQTIGLLLFALAGGILLARNAPWLRPDASSEQELAARLFLVAGATYCAFFFFVTHMHENHLFLAMPLLLAVAGRDRSLGWLALGCAVASFVNMILHDPRLPYSLPFFLSNPSSAMDPHLLRPYTWLQIVGSFVNSLLVGAVTAGAFYLAWRPRRI
jgi:Gpi18-like mannosyltransferase